jgi:hypothetical protein
MSRLMRLIGLTVLSLISTVFILGSAPATATTSTSAAPASAADTWIPCC